MEEVDLTWIVGYNDPNEIIGEVPLTRAEYMILKIMLESAVLEMRWDIERRKSMAMYNNLCVKFGLKKQFLSYEEGSEEALALENE